jgi:3-oxoadipate enol-lactonase
MPKRRIHGVDLEVQDIGTGPTICFSHGLLWSHRMFAPQIEALRGKYRCVAWDHRGQGQSEVPPTASVTIEQVTADAIALIEETGIAPVHFVGLSMGGFVGMRIAARRPELVRSLSLLETAADPEPRKHLPRYRLLAILARVFGMRGFLVDRVMKIMCAPSFLQDPANAARVAELRAMMSSNDRSIVKAVYGVLEREGVEHELPNIRCPVMVLRGTEDMAIARERSLRLAELTKARWVEIPGAGHTSSLEQPEAVTRALQDFLE